ncbi:MAG TPA: TMEM175 family protein [Methanoregulaceae archaeon]|nr:TMEM175 family protein [Methanoregulaceae archaeon]
MTDTTDDDGPQISKAAQAQIDPEGLCRSPERIVSLSDGVFAFAITLLALSLVVPVLTRGAVESELVQDLFDMAPVFLSYFISFFVIASWWRGHHRIFSHIQRCNGITISLNFYFLLCITIIPFLTSLITQYGHYHLATILYASIQAITGTILMILWVYVSKNHRMIDPHLSNQMIRFIFNRQLLVIAIFLLSIPIAMINTTVAQVSWIAIAPLVGLMRRAYRDIEVFVEDEMFESKRK